MAVVRAHTCGILGSQLRGCHIIASRNELFVTLADWMVTLNRIILNLAQGLRLVILEFRAVMGALA